MHSSEMCSFLNSQDGYFMIRRGTNECGIEEDVVAGMASTRNLVQEVASGGADTDASY